MDTTELTTSISNNISSADVANGLAFGGTLFAIIMMSALAAGLICYIVYSILLGKIFKKAGVKSSIAWIPFYNTWKMFEIGDQKGAFSLFLYLPPLTIVGTVFSWISMYNIGKKLGKEDWFIAIAVLASPVWLAILALDKSTWNGVAAPLAAATPDAAPAYTPPAVDSNTFSQPVESPAPVEQPMTPAEPVAPASPAADDFGSTTTETTTEPTTIETTEPTAPTDSFDQQ